MEDVPLANREINHKNQHLRTFFHGNKLLHDLLVMVVMGFFIGFLAPFGMDSVPLHWSIGYWIFTCLCGYSIYSPCTFLGELYLPKFIKIHWVRVAISSSVASIIMTFFVPFSAWLFFNQPVYYGYQFFDVLPKVFVIGGILTLISLIKDYIYKQNQTLSETEQKIAEHQQQSHLDNSVQIEQFMALLPLDKRGTLYCLEMSDHYLKVYTDKGHHLLLMRFKDALVRLNQYPGFQTHRSWWVATNAIIKVNKKGRKLSLQLVNELEVPISRTYADTIKAAGIH